MSYNGTNPVTVGSGTLKSQYDRVFSNTIALYAGAMSLASQAAFDLLYAASTTQLGRLANGTTGQVLRAVTGAAPTWGTLTATAVMADLTGTTPAPILDITVPAGLFANGGDMIRALIYFKYKNDSGVTGTLTYGIKPGASALANISPTGFTPSPLEFERIVGITIMRDGADLIMWRADSPNELARATPASVAGAYTLSIYGTLSVNDPTFYVHPKQNVVEVVQHS